MAELSMELPKVTLGIRVKVPRGYKVRMAVLFFVFRVAAFVAPPNVLVEVATDGHP